MEVGGTTWKWLETSNESRRMSSNTDVVYRKPLEGAGAYEHQMESNGRRWSL
jgi:hypothetical protein